MANAEDYSTKGPPLLLQLKELLENMDTRYLLAEPNIIQVYSLLGASSFKLSKLKDRIDVLCGVDSSCVKLGGKGNVKAYLPLAPLPPEYAYPEILARASTRVLNELNKLGSIPLVHDYHDLVTGLNCKPRIGCIKNKATAAAPLEPGSKMETDMYRPLICLPMIFSPRCIRTRRTIYLHVPWLTIGYPGSFKTIICAEEGLHCGYVIDGAKGLVETVNGRSIVLESRNLSLTFLSINTFLHNMYSKLDASRINFKRPHLWIRGNAIIVDLRVHHKSNNTFRIDALLWNPSPSPSHIVVMVSGFRIVSGFIVHTGEKLMPEYDRVGLVLRRLGVVNVELILRSTPRILALRASAP